MLCLHQHHDFGCLCFDEVGYTHVVPSLLKKLFCSIYFSCNLYDNLHTCLINICNQSAGNHLVFGVLLSAGNICNAHLTCDPKKPPKKRKRKKKTPALHPPKKPKTSPTPACSAPGCPKIQHHCHETRRKLQSSSCEAGFILQPPTSRS